MQIERAILIAPHPADAPPHVKQGDPREWVFCVNHAAQKEIEDRSGKPCWQVLVDPAETVSRLSLLAWAASQSYRKGTRINITWEQFLEGGYLPDYLSDEWFEFQDALTSLVNDSFPKAAQNRNQLQTLAAAQMLSSLANTRRLIGTSESTPASDVSEECPPTSSGTSGTGATLTSS